eukprot:2114767-Pyramimonas_sp.AAC.1
MNHEKGVASVHAARAIAEDFVALYTKKPILVDRNSVPADEVVAVSNDPVGADDYVDPYGDYDAFADKSVAQLMGFTPLRAHEAFNLNQIQSALSAMAEVAPTRPVSMGTEEEA